MSFEKQFDDFIEAGRHVIDTDFDPIAFQQWRTHAVMCLSALMGYNHAYAKCFVAHHKDPKQNNLVVGGGILEEANHGLLKKFHGEQRSAKRNSLECDSDVPLGTPKCGHRGNGTNCERHLPYCPASNGRSSRVQEKKEK